MRPVPGSSAGMESETSRRERLHRAFSGGTRNPSEKRTANMNFGTGEGHLFPNYEYSETAFETSFTGMGLAAPEARALSSELHRGGAVVTVSPGDRASLAEGIIQRNHGSIRFENISGTGEVSEGSCVEMYGRMCNYYHPEESVRRRAS